MLAHKVLNPFKTSQHNVTPVEHFACRMQAYLEFLEFLNVE